MYEQKEKREYCTMDHEHKIKKTRRETNKYQIRARLWIFRPHPLVHHQSLQLLG